MRATARFRALPRPERWLLVRAAALLVVVRVALRLLPYTAVHAWCARLARLARPAPARGPHPPQRIAWAVRAAARGVPGGRHCLTQALVAHVLFGRAGCETRVRFGVARRDGGELEAHAWLEGDSGVLVGARGRFTALALPSRAGTA